MIWYQIFSSIICLRLFNRSFSKGFNIVDNSDMGQYDLPDFGNIMASAAFQMKGTCLSVNAALNNAAN